MIESGETPTSAEPLLEPRFLWKRGSALQAKKHGTGREGALLQENATNLSVPIPRHPARAGDGRPANKQISPKDSAEFVTNKPPSVARNGFRIRTFAILAG